jgi:hypothetical protein
MLSFFRGCQIRAEALQIRSITAETVKVVVRPRRPTDYFLLLRCMSGACFGGVVTEASEAEIGEVTSGKVVEM